jgi:hypothetical protein
VTSCFRRRLPARILGVVVNADLRSNRTEGTSVTTDHEGRSLVGQLRVSPETETRAVRLPAGGRTRRGNSCHLSTRSTLIPTRAAPRAASLLRSPGSGSRPGYTRETGRQERRLGRRGRRRATGTPAPVAPVDRTACVRGLSRRCASRSAVPPPSSSAGRVRRVRRERDRSRHRYRWRDRSRRRRLDGGLIVSASCA